MNVSSLIAVVKATAAAMVPAIPATIEAGKAVIAYVREVSSTLSEDDQLALQQALPSILDRMDAAVDKAIDDLSG